MTKTYEINSGGSVATVVLPDTSETPPKITPPEQQYGSCGNGHTGPLHGVCTQVECNGIPFRQ